MAANKPEKSIWPALTKIWQELALADVLPKLKAFGILIVCVFSLFFLVAAPFELFTVRDVATWRAQRAEIINVSLERSSTRPHMSHWVFIIKLTETAEQVTITDIRPGDLPTSVLWWSTMDAEAERFQAGQSVEVFRSPEGGKVFLERGGYGFMSSVLLACLAFWIWILWNAQRKPRA